ncbi:hypothetical protein CEE45_08060 [Candidatus Heimdallarchaeota archaeon B3_Heim]|nr:MAG: hypothetical protein CEE45_08060 [Candidatus Heimdallarchaeota archaeon B3_Heim]
MDTPSTDSRSLEDITKEIKFISISAVKNLYNQIAVNKFNIICLILFILVPIVYRVLYLFVDIRGYDEYLRSTESYLVFDEFLTVFAQKALGTTNSLIGIAAALFYTYGFLSISATAYLVLFTLIIREKKYRQREPYIYIALTTIMFLIDISGYWLFPTAPPVRLFSELHYRILVVPFGDSLISIKYNAFPSGHIWALTVPYIAAKAENLKYWEALFGSAIIITSWVVILTGDHYIIDAFVSYFICIFLYTIFSTIHDYHYNKSKIASKDILIKRYRSLLVVSAILVIISILTLQFINDYILIIQVLCIMVVWPLIVLKTDVNGLLDTNNRIHRSSIQDYKDFVTKVIEDSKKSS